MGGCKVFAILNAIDQYCKPHNCRNVAKIPKAPKSICSNNDGDILAVFCTDLPWLDLTNRN